MLYFSDDIDVLSFVSVVCCVNVCKLCCLLSKNNKNIPIMLTHPVLYINVIISL